jgi:hypothetical protein
VPVQRRLPLPHSGKPRAHWGAPPQIGGAVIGSQNRRMSIAMTGHRSIAVIGGLPIRGDCNLRLRERDLPRAYEALQLDLEAVFAPGFGPGLELEVVECTRVTSKCQWHNVVELILAGTRRILAGCLQTRISSRRSSLA